MFTLRRRTCSVPLRPPLRHLMRLILLLLTWLSSSPPLSRFLAVTVRGVLPKSKRSLEAVSVSVASSTNRDITMAKIPSRLPADAIYTAVTAPYSVVSYAVHLNQGCIEYLVTVCRISGRFSLSDSGSAAPVGYAFSYPVLFGSGRIPKTIIRCISNADVHMIDDTENVLRRRML